MLRRPERSHLQFIAIVCGVVLLLTSDNCHAQSTGLLESELKSLEIQKIVQDVETLGDAQRGAMVFYRAELNCVKCHEPVSISSKTEPNQLGPVLELLGPATETSHLVESLLAPSKTIRDGYTTVSITDSEGRQFNALFIEENESTITYRDLDSAKPITVPKQELDDFAISKVSVMPEGLINQLRSRQEFFDLAKYLRDIANDGPNRKLQLKPLGALTQLAPLPEYEKHVDHLGLIKSLDNNSLKRGEEIYRLNCQSCHGTTMEVGSMPTSLRFSQGKFKKGNDPYSMYQTLSHGYSMMVAQRWMVPKQKYDVIHFIREKLIRQNNKKEYFDITDKYLTDLPPGDTFGPEPVDRRPWQQMNYGPAMMGTFEIGDDASNFAYKGIAVQLDNQPGGVSQGKDWIVYDHDTMRVAAAWTGKGFIDWNGIHFDGQHNAHPHIVGDVVFENKNGPGWANPASDDFEDMRISGRDQRRYGPLPRAWLKFLGVSNFGNQSILHYRVGDTEIKEMPVLFSANSTPVFQRVFNIGPRSHPLTLQIQNVDPDAKTAKGFSPSCLVFDSSKGKLTAGSNQKTFDGSSWFGAKTGSDKFDFNENDYTIWCRIKTQQNDGTIFASAPNQGEWCPDGKTFFLRNGRLCFDIGWVGAVQGKSKVNDGKWHNVALTWRKKDGRVRMFVDGTLDATGRLIPEGRDENLIVKIGFTSKNFPTKPFFEGNISQVTFVQKELSENEVADFDGSRLDKEFLASWELESLGQKKSVTDSINSIKVTRFGSSKIPSEPKPISIIAKSIQAFPKNAPAMKWLIADGNRSLRLEIPAGEEPLHFSLFQAAATDIDAARKIVDELPLDQFGADLDAFTQGGPARWPQTFSTKIETRFDQGPFAVDYLLHPQQTPWNCRMRLTGMDFYRDANVCAVCSWDGSVWRVSGLNDKSGNLTWQRIASGLFQPLGIKIVNDQVFVSCRDQIVRLRDLNEDNETDYYECFNNDHQVTEHFHEFAMGLQTDDDGNFYYAKSARHAKTPLVPHHGTLLKVSRDGTDTEIVAYGFRAANGVCVNPDGSFIVTDQEGHWNPKNRINWVRPGGFYGNMWGYHQITDVSDAAMDAPLCWITNSFDRSPSELMWVAPPAKWGPLNNMLLNFSYGYGKLFVVPHENIDGQMQGGMCEIPIPQFPTGIMRGRFSPADGQLYCCGMFAWGGNQTTAGGLYRVRYTGKPVYLPTSIEAHRGKLIIKFSDKLDVDSVQNADNFSIKSWHIKRSKNYGSDHFDEKQLPVKKATLGTDGKTITVEIPDLAPTRCMEIKYQLYSAGTDKTSSQKVDGVIHNTIHKLR